MPSKIHTGPAAALEGLLFDGMPWNGGAIALGDPLGMNGRRLAMTAAEELDRVGRRSAPAIMCIGIGQGLTVLLEWV